MATNGHKNAALLYADTQRSTIGTHSYICRELSGKPVLRRTLERLHNVTSLDEIIVFCPTDQVDAIMPLLQGTTAEVIGLNEAVPLNSYVKRRKWSLASWRGGIHEATVDDELAATQEMVRHLRQRNIYTALAVPAEAALIDAQLLNELLDHHHQHAETVRFTFTQAAPGLACSAFRLDLLHELTLTGGHIGDLIAYRPDAPQADFIMGDSCYRVDSALYLTPFRFLADNRRSFEMLGNLLAGENGHPVSASEAIAAVKPCLRQPGRLPAELEIEITSEPSLRIGGYPHGTVSRGPMSPDQFGQIVASCRPYDDICLTLGGFGEPLAHPQLKEIIAMAKAAGIFAINIETDGRRLDDNLANMLLNSGIDVLSVFLDADSEELYRQVKGQGGFDELAARLETFITASQKINGPQVVPHLVKTRRTMADMERFYDRWLTACGAAVITGYNDFAGQIHDQSVMNMCPPRRFPCRRLWRCLSILADGTATICSQDFKALYPIGSAFETGVEQLWNGDKLNQLRQEHLDNDYHHPLCNLCKHWPR